MSKVKTKVRFMDILKEQNPETMIYVGTVEGSGWLFIEAAKTLLENIEEVEERLKEDATAKYDNAKLRLSLYPRFLAGLQDQIRELEQEGQTGSDEYKQKQKQLRKGETKYVSSYKARQKYGKLLNNWIPLADREVVEVREHKTDYVGMSLIIKGFENGVLWSRDEIVNGGND